MTFQALPGFRDFPPGDLAFRSHIFAVWRRVALRYGFEEYDGPPLEPLDLYTSKSGDEIVGQLYNFVDKGNRPVALRPEMTPTLARMVAERANGLKKPIRWFAIPQLFRYERQQRGRLREHFQLNCDLIGEAGPLADAEIIALAIDMMREFGLTAKDVRVRVSDRRLLAALLASHVKGQDLAKAFNAIDKLERAGPDETRTRLSADGFSAEAIDAIVRVANLRGLDALATAVRESGLSVEDSSLTQTIASLEAMGLADWIDVDMTIVRGLAYYTGTVFELFDAGKTLRAICGGGRYDTLLQQLGGVDLPALGFGMGDVVLGELLKDRGLMPAAAAGIDLLVAGITAEDMPHVLSLSHTLRDAGLRVEYTFSQPGLGKQLKFADSRGARLAVVVGPDDRARGEVQIKDLAGKSQEAVGLADVPRRCRELIESSPHERMT